ncbi:MAG: WecB/TagA/CpsF family glycosyltransferase [Hominicoprocola sp.]
MRIDILGVGFDRVTMGEALARGEELLCGEGTHYVVTPNPEIVETCRKNAEANRAVNGAALVLPDGIGVIYGAKMLGTPLKERVPGIEFGTAMLERCAALGKTVYLLGAKPGVAEAASENLKKKLPGLQIAGTHDGYFKDDAAVAGEIRASGADMALVCLGAPKQELFMADYGEATGCRLLMGLGGSLDIFAGVAQRAPEFYCRHNLEWFYRLIKNPSRIGRMMKLPLFLVHVVGAKKR